MEGIEQIVVWPPARIAVWDRQSGDIGVWNDSLTVGSTVAVVDASSVGYDLYGVGADSTVVVGRGRSFSQMPIGVFANPHTLMAFRNAQPVSISKHEVPGSWLSVVAVGDQRSGRSIRSYAESFVTSTKHDTYILDARDCVLSNFGGTVRETLNLPSCPGSPGFRAAVLAQLDSAKDDPFSEEHRRRARASEIPESYTGVIDFQSSYASGELALRLRAKAGQAVDRWMMLDVERKPHVLIELDFSWRLIGFSDAYLLLVRRDTDTDAAPTAVYWVPRKLLIDAKAR